MAENLGDFLAEKARALGDRPFLYWEGKTVSWAMLDREAAGMARLLKALGVKKGDKVAVMLANRPEFLYAWFGLAKLGAVMVPLNIHLKGMSLRYIIGHSDAAVIITESGFTGQVDAATADIPGIRRKIALSPEGTPCPEGYTDLAAGLKEAASMPLGPAQVRGADLMSILYTSGTTGQPKGVMLSHCSYLNTGRESVQVHRIKPDDVFYTCLPLFHINAQQLTTMGCLTGQIPMVLGRRFSVSNFWREINGHRATLTVFIGSMAAMLFKQEARDSDRDNSLRFATCAAMPKEIWRDFEERFQVKMVECYGLTESSTLATANPYDAVRVGSIGRPVSFTEVRIRDENGATAKPGQVGEIAVRGRYPHVLMEGYYKMPEKTAEAMPDGWFLTGDRGFCDADGYFYFVDRSKECIRRRGENISSFEIEKIVNTHPDVLESAAVGVPSEFGEEDVKLCVVPRPGRVPAPEEIHRFCREAMAYFMVPRYIVIKDDLPKTSTQRIQKYVLKEEGTCGCWDAGK